MTVERNTITEVCAPGEYRRCSAATRERRLQSGILFTLAFIHVERLRPIGEIHVRIPKKMEEMSDSTIQENRLPHLTTSLID